MLAIPVVKMVEANVIHLRMSSIPDVLGRMLFSAKSFKQVSTSYIHEQFLQGIGPLLHISHIRDRLAEEDKNLLTIRTEKSTCGYAIYIHCVQFVPVSSGVTDPRIAQCW